MTFDKPAKGTYDVCKLCDWEDDFVQNEDPDCEVGANGICLRDAQYAFLKETANTESYIKDLYWKLLEPPSKESRLKNSKTDFVVTSKGEVKNA